MPVTLGTVLAYTGVSAETAGVIGGVAATAAPVVASAAVTAGANALLAPKPPKVPGVTPMPDEMAMQEQRKRSIAEQMARRGRAASIMTEAPAAGTLGG